MSAPFADVLFEALANGLWRGAVLALAVALLLRLFQRTTAAERYAVWLAVLTVIALAPAAEVAVRSMQPVETATPLVLMETTLPAADWALPAGGAATAPRWQPVEVAAAPFLLLWLAVGAFFVVRLWRRCSMAAALKRSSAVPEPELAAAVEAWERDLTTRRVGATRVSRSLRAPAAVGWLTPVVLLPRSAEADGHRGDLELLWKHEQAHVSRRDDWTQLLAEALFAAAWFHPATYWVRRQLEQERELACDEAVLDGGVEARRYAGALGRWAERAAMSQLPAGVMGLGRSPALIIRRIEMLLSTSRILRRNGGRLAFGVSLVAAVVAAGLLILGAPTAIRAQSIVAPSEPDIVLEVLEPVVVVQTVRADVRVEISTPVTKVEVDVEPVLLSQAAPPAPQPAPAPSAAPAPPVPSVPAVPSAAPVPPVPPVPPAPPVEWNSELREQSKAIAEQARRWQEEMRPEIEAIQQETQRMQEYVRESFAPQQEKLQALARKLSEEHSKTIGPLAEEMARLGAKIGQAFDAEQREELQKQMKEVGKRMEERGPEFKRLEEEMSHIQIDMKPFEERMKELGEALKEKHEALEEARREFEESNQ